MGRVREQNEDCFVVDVDLGLYAVSDGMGGHAGGEIASRTAIAAVHEVVKLHRDEIGRIAEGEETQDALVQIAELAVSEAALRVYELATSDEGPSGMGCTLTVLLLAGDVGAVAHVGDSRLFRLRGQLVTQLSHDHTMIAEMARLGIGDLDALRDGPFAHVLSRAVGPQAGVQAESLGFQAVPGDRYLLCSDGFSNYLEATEGLAKTLTEGLDEEGMGAAADAFINMALDGGGEDNVTVVLAAVTGDAERPGRAEAVERRYAALRSMFMFSELDHAMVARVLEVCRVQAHDVGDVVVELGDETSELFVVVDGEYELADDGGVIGTLGPGEFAGATTLMRPRASRARLEATMRSRMLRLTGAAFSKLIRRRPWLGIFLLERLGNKLSNDLDRSYQQREGSPEKVRVRERF